MKTLWINDKAEFTGGAETYIYQSAKELSKKYDVENILLYSTESRIDHEYSKAFSFATVIANFEQQVQAINPDIIYVHQVSDIEILKSLLTIDTPVVAFIHDHKNFCLREHKYTTLGNETCTKAIGMDCYTCLGFINKQNEFPYISIKSLSSIKSIQNILKSFNHIIVASAYMKEHLTLHNFNEEKISKLTLFSKLEKNLTINSTNLKEKRFLFVGQLVRGKGVDTLLNAFAKLQTEEAFLDICGEGKQRNQLEEQAKNLGINTRVKFHGKIIANKLNDYYTQAYAVVIPSRAPETFNLVGVEAMKHSKAVIATEVGGIQEWLKNEKNGFLFPSNNDEELASLLKEAINNPAKIKEMGKIGFKNYNNKFTPEEHCKKLYNLFKTFVKKDYHAA